MKITTFNPQVITNDPEPIAELFEELGFERRHKKEVIGEKNVTGIRMKDSGGFYMDNSNPDIKLPSDIATIRMNVDNFDEEYEMLLAHGFKNYYGDNNAVTPSSKSALMIAPSGFSINLVEHIKDHEQ